MFQLHLPSALYKHILFAHQEELVEYTVIGQLDILSRGGVCFTCLTRQTFHFELSGRGSFQWACLLPESLFTSHVTPGENAIGFSWSRIRTTRIGCEFYLLDQGEPECLWGDSCSLRRSFVSVACLRAHSGLTLWGPMD